ncbi:uncharacterized protein L3040_004781 [Drepanopeziza brunnea f. sp. 'multigermtubi']|uniref:uncharacterized protein n=1 Tax=Drepanopeziza brunnea f. sp. 'multigermtubi' TaxID=698441 RepID=UPI00238F025B|nr:hypothetical protein L3040_004781 [Drepanopeziza brunnea f. sp. 'multigermtubi']
MQGPKASTTTSASKVLTVIAQGLYTVVAVFDSQAYLALGIKGIGYPFQHQQQHLPFYLAATASELTRSVDRQLSLPLSSDRYTSQTSPLYPQQNTQHTQRTYSMTALKSSELTEDGGPIQPAANKPKRVRTGCLTCRERHLKCDEGYSAKNKGCANCRKSSRTCKRGVRLNFIDTQVQDPPIIPPTADWKVKFQDESREIASEYQGGLRRYAHLDRTITPPQEPSQYLSSPEEVLFMQVFVEEVGLWMDSMDDQKHFSRILPFHALSESMLLNAFLACGARHLTLVNPMYHEDKALYYYDTATTQLLKSLQNPDRDTVCCATTAVILNVYEIMSERAMQRMNHIAGARALIKECGWNARSTGIGAACFWLNVGMELLSCLHFNWQVAWEPDQWGLDMNLQAETESGKEEIWVHRMLYIVGKIANFRASVPRFQEASPHDEQVRLQTRFSEWKRWKDLCDRWNANVPRTMQPMGFLHPPQTTSKSAFPEVWLIKRATIVGRLFYHTAMCLLAQINPLMSTDTEEMNHMQMHHAHLICGIVAHVKDRGVASVALRSLAIAAECLVHRREQEEVLEIFEKIRKETGWKVGFISTDLKKKWGFPSDDLQQSPMAPQSSNSLGQFFHNTQAPATSRPPAPPPSRPALPSGILNPLLAKADFSLPNHPYQQYYQPPNQIVHHSQNHFGPPPPQHNNNHYPPPYA